MMNFKKGSFNGKETEKVAEQIFLKSQTERSGIIAQYIW